jgi:dienelactone hydrolase
VKQFLAVTFLIFTLVLSACSRPQEVPTAEQLEEKARDFITLTSSEKYEEAHRMFENKMASSLSKEGLQELWEGIVLQTGALQSITKMRLAEESGYQIVYVTCLFEKSIMDIKIVFDNKAQIAGLWLGNPETTQYTPPIYAKSDSFTEEEVTVGAEGWPLPGTLSLPKGQGPFPAVVLVHGSGPNDRDESIGPNKPLKDLAWGLSSKGIAVLRYDKRTRVHAERLTQLGSDFTVKEEVIDDVLAAIKSLSQAEKVNSQKIVVVGHSLGGSLIPRIVKDAINEGLPIAGAVSLAGTPRNLLDLVIEQIEYISKIDGTVDDNEATAIQDAQAQVEKIKAGTQGENEILLGAPKKYWTDLLEYDPIETAKDIGIPMLFLQGERDYQVLSSKDFEMWKEGLSSRSDIAFKSYPDLNHLFITGKGPSTPAEYELPNNVHSAVIDDIASFIETLPTFAAK